MTMHFCFASWVRQSAPSVKARLALLLALLLAGSAGAQQTTPPLSPSEALTAAMAPFNAARAQADDLTEADSLALAVGVAQASHDCQAASAKPQAFAADPAQLLALGRLCIFGQQFEPARLALVRALALPAPPQRELTLLLLVRALLGLKDVGNAQLQVVSLLRDYPYDAQIHYAADQVIDAAEGINLEMSATALQLCAKQDAMTLPLLLSGKTLTGTEGTAPPSLLYADALRCATLARATGDLSASDPVRRDQLQAIPQVAAWQGTAELAPMQQALARSQMRSSPLAALKGQGLTSTGTLTPRTLPLSQGIVALIPFALWAPSASFVLQTLALSAPRQPLYAITSWAANTGLADQPSPEMLLRLRAFQAKLPAHVSLLIVPDDQLRAFHADVFSTGVVIREGLVVSNAVMAGEGAMRMLLLTLPAAGPAPGAREPAKHK